MRSSPPKDFNFNQTMELSAAYSWQSSLSVWPPARLPLEVSLGEVMIRVRDWPWTPTPRGKPQCWPLSPTSLRLWASSSKFLHFQILAAHVLPLGQWQDGPKLCQSSRYPRVRRRSHPSDLGARCRKPLMRKREASLWRKAQLCSPANRFIMMTWPQKAKGQNGTHSAASL